MFSFIYFLHFPETVFRNIYFSRHTQLSRAQSEFIFRIVSRTCLDVSSVSSVSPHLGRQLHPEPIERLQVLALSSLRRVLKCLQPMCSFKASFDANICFGCKNLKLILWFISQLQCAAWYCNPIYVSMWWPHLCKSLVSRPTRCIVQRCASESLCYMNCAICFMI